MIIGTGDANWTANDFPLAKAELTTLKWYNDAREYVHHSGYFLGFSKDAEKESG